MIMLKNTKSAQEYDQAIFRIQSQYVIEKELVNDTPKNNREPKLIRIDMKPQTILVDFDPMRMFELQGLSAKVVNEVKHGYTSLEDTVKEELEFFPIITYNANQLVKVDANNLVEIITKYNSEKSIMDETVKVQLSDELLKDADIYRYIESQSEAGLSNKLTTDPHTGPESGFDAAGLGRGQAKKSKNENAENSSSNSKKELSKTEKEKLLKKYRMCIARLSFYAFLSKKLSLF